MKRGKAKKRTVSRGDKAKTKAPAIDWRNESKSPKVQENQAIARNAKAVAEEAGYTDLHIICKSAMEGGIAYLDCLKTHLPGVTGNGCSNKDKCMSKWARLYYKPKLRRRRRHV